MFYPPMITRADVERARLSRQNADVAPMILARWFENGGIIPNRRRFDETFIGSPSGRVTANSDLFERCQFETYRVTVATGFWEYHPPWANAFAQMPVPATRPATRGFDLVTLAAHRFHYWFATLEAADAYVRSFMP